jgi:DNA-binding response OmpR family regulator
VLTILIVEDEAKVAKFIQRGLQAEGMHADIASSGTEGLERALSTRYDVITVDLLLPGIDGFALIEKLREKKITSQILILSAKDALGDKLKGFAVGTDDYLPKPFAFEELIARIRALSRRNESKGEWTRILEYADLRMDLETHSVERAGRSIELTQREFRLLEFFLRNPEKVLTRARIGETVWREQFERESNVVEVYMMYIRKKIDQGSAQPLLHTVRGVGYVLRQGSSE